MKKAEEVTSKGEEISDLQLSFLRSHLDNRMYMLARRAGGGISRWLSKQWEAVAVAKPPLSALAKIQLGPRHHVTLLEADGMRLLVATSSDGGVAIHSLPGVTGGGSVGGGLHCCCTADCPALKRQPILQSSHQWWTGGAALEVVPAHPSMRPLAKHDDRMPPERRAYRSADTGVRARMGRVSW